MRETLPWGQHHFYAGLARRAFLPVYRRLAAGIPVNPPVLDVGCGPGDLAHALSEKQPTIGVDLDHRMIKMARVRNKERPDLTFRQGDVAALPFGDATFGHVWTSESFHHWADPAAGLKEIHRVLRPGGQLWIVEARPEMTRHEFREAFGVPAFPGLFLLARLVVRAHGLDDNAAAVAVARMRDAGFTVDAQVHGAWRVLEGTKAARATS